MEVEVSAAEALAEVTVVEGTVVLVLPEVVVVDSPLLDVVLAGEPLSTPLEKIRMQARTAMPRLCDQRAAILIHGTLGEKVA